MTTTTVRVSTETRDRLRALADLAGKPMHQVVDEALAAYRRERFFAELDAGYAALRADPSAWSEVLGERAEMEGALGDGLAEV